MLLRLPAAFFLKPRFSEKRERKAEIEEELLGSVALLGGINYSALERKTTRRDEEFSVRSFRRIRVFLYGVLPRSDFPLVHESVVILMSQENQCHTPRIGAIPPGNPCSVFSLLKTLDS